MFPKVKAIANSPLAIALVVVVGLAIAAHIYKSGDGTPGPGPGPYRPAHDTARVNAGKDRIEDLKEAYAKALRTAGDAIGAGQGIEEAKNAEQTTFEKELQASFNEKLAPFLVQIAPDDTPISPEQRAALQAAYRDFAFGVSGKDTSNPSTGPPPVVAAARAMFGWVDHPARREALINELPQRTFTAAAPQLITGATRDVFLYKAWRDILGNYPTYPAQQIGDCTSFGSSHALDLLQCIDLKLGKGNAKDYRETSTEVVYGLSRECAGMLGARGDGSYGVATAKALTNFGSLPREAVGTYSGARAKQFGRSGVPADLKAKAAEFKLGSATLVTTLAEADAALMNGYPFIVCSNQGFTTQRNQDGVCEASGRWPHCMFVAGRRDRGTESQYLMCQSWGETMPSGPISDDQPPWSFWVRGSTLARMIEGEDSLAFSSFHGFTGRKLPEHWHYAGFFQPGPLGEDIEPTAPKEKATDARVIPTPPLAKPEAAPVRPAPQVPALRPAA